MQSASIPFEDPQDRVEFVNPPHLGGVELYRAHIVRCSFEPHTHEAFGLGAIEAGVERFRYAGTEHIAPPQSLVLMNPDELHTGRAETESGWQYRMIYIDADVIERVTGEPGWWFADVVRQDPVTSRRISALLHAMWSADEPLAFDSLLHVLLSEFRRHATVPRAAPNEAAIRFAPVIEYLRAHFSQRLSLDELAAVVGLSPFHFLRRFQAQYHATPQQMLMALRLSRAKRLLAAGMPAASVAAATGLTDQAHLTRAFARRYGLTPVRYQRQVRR